MQGECMEGHERLLSHLTLLTLLLLLPLHLLPSVLVPFPGTQVCAEVHKLTDYSRSSSPRPAHGGLCRVQGAGCRRAGVQACRDEPGGGDPSLLPRLRTVYHLNMKGSINVPNSHHQLPEYQDSEGVSGFPLAQD